MLESDSVDDDFFTPTAPTTLANIFGDTSKLKPDENPSLKYIPPKEKNPDNKSIQSDSVTKASECLFALALFAYEFMDGSYLPRGKLGFAVMKIFTPHNIKLVLYDAAKNTLSHVTITENFEIKVQKNNYFTYVDDVNKTWSLVGASSEECHNIIEEFKKHNIKLNYEDNLVHYPTIAQKPKLSSNVKILSELKIAQSDQECDTDSSLNKDTKTSILNKMAKIMQSNLPRQVLKDQTSDSSDTNEIEHSDRNERHRPLKNNTKRFNSDRGITDIASTSTKNVMNTDNTILLPAMSTNSDIIPLYTTVNGQLVPVTHTNITSHSISNISERNDNINVLFSEQRISNTELRLSINKVSNKIDEVLEKVKLNDKLDVSNNSSTFTTDIYRKLLTEYENKIKEQGEKIKFLEEVNNALHRDVNINLDYVEIMKNNELYKIQIKNFETKIKEKEDEINGLSDQLSLFTNSSAGLNIDSCDKDLLLDKIKEQEQQICDLKIFKDNNSKNINEIELLTKQNIELHNNFDKAVKTIMNNTFHTLSAELKNSESYSGDVIKRKIARTIKNITSQVISEGHTH